MTRLKAAFGGRNGTLQRPSLSAVIRDRDSIGQRSETVRRANLSAIVSELHAHGPLSRSELVVRTGLTRTAIRTLIGELVSADLVAEERAAPVGTPGRPSRLVRLNAERAVVLALEVAVDSLAVAEVGLGGKILSLVRVDRPRGHLSLDETVADLAALASSALSESPNRDSLIGIGVAVAAVVRRTDGFVAMAPNLGWRDLPFGERLGRAIGDRVPIAIANEADLGALGEVRRGAAKGGDHVLFIYGEVGVGGGLIVDGKPLTGVAGYAGEIGHIPVNMNGVACGCGSVGCWETEVGGRALLVRAGHPPDGGLGEIDAVLREAEAGSAVALGALDQVARWLGFGLAGLINIFNPRLVVLGGLFGRIFPFVRTRLESELDRRALPAARRLVGVVPATLGVNAPLLGAAELAFEPLLADPAGWLYPRAGTLVLASA